MPPKNLTSRTLKAKGRDYLRLDKATCLSIINDQGTPIPGEAATMQRDVMVGYIKQRDTTGASRGREAAAAAAAM